MKKVKKSGSQNMRANYTRADFPKGLTRGKYAQRLTQSNMVRLDPEIHAAFPTSKAVNEALGGLLRLAKTAKVSTKPAARSSLPRR